MAFKIPTKIKVKPKSPVELFNQLGKVDRLGLEQGKSLETYEKVSDEHRDIAIEMPAGQGKTLVGGLIGEYNRITKDKRVVYCCATKQLASQTNDLLISYGINSVLLINQRKDFDEKSYRQYSRSVSIAVTTYSHIFNTNSAFKDANLIIFDDAHATEYSINDLWSLDIDNRRDKNIFEGLYSILRDSIPKQLQDKIDHGIYNPLIDGVDLIPQPLWIDRIDDIRAYMDSVTDQTNLYFSWSKIRDFLYGCQIFMTPKKIVFKPSISPNWLHDAFSNTQERIYMSATLGAEGELERVFGVTEIKRISEFTEGANKVSGKRLILFPEDHFGREDLSNVIIQTIRMQPRVLILFPSHAQLEADKKFLEENLPEYEIFLNHDVEESLEVFKASQKGILLLAGRYEGIDLKDDDCRLQIFVDLPIAVGVTEQFLQSRLRVSELLQNRLATRVIQGLGRCTRDKNDYSAVLFIGRRVGEYLFKNEFRKLLPPEVDAELSFGFEQIDNITDIEEWKKSLQSFYDQDDDWKSVEEYLKSETEAIQEERKTKTVSTILRECATPEIEFQNKLINKDFEVANSEASKVLEKLSRQEEYKGYRAWWNYNIACVKKQQGNTDQSIKYLKKALSSSSNKLWLDREIFDTQISDDQFFDISVEMQLEKILDKLLSYGDRDNKFERDWKAILEGLENKDSDIYEIALKEVGEFYGFETTRPTGNGTPDGTWSINNQWFVFEAKTNIKDPNTPISLDDMRQAGYHSRWVTTNYKVGSEAEIKAVMLCEKSNIYDYAEHVADDIFLKSPKEFLELTNLFGNILRTALLKIKHDSLDEAKLYLGKSIVKEKLTVEDLKSIFTETELKDVIKP
ncbi:helicase C-terminal domain-containing protein [Planococcus sp. YIM B11945]|uniref:helicase C-terminal domain-containing protein n=1 Tax=Planococcus sp. YIM B11945 TaxID=3435410 RepID=UPI003D7F12FF